MWARPLPDTRPCSRTYFVTVIFPFSVTNNVVCPLFLNNVVCPLFLRPKRYPPPESLIQSRIVSRR